MTNAPYTVFQTTDELFIYLASEFERYSHCSDIQHICLSGGSTPKGLFTYIVNTKFKASIKWSNLHFGGVMNAVLILVMTRAITVKPNGCYLTI